MFKNYVIEPCTGQRRKVKGSKEVASCLHAVNMKIRPVTLNDVLKEFKFETLTNDENFIMLKTNQDFLNVVMKIHQLSDGDYMANFKIIVRHDEKLES